VSKPETESKMRALSPLGTVLHGLFAAVVAVSPSARAEAPPTFVPGTPVPSPLAFPLPDDDEEWHLPPPAIAPDEKPLVIAGVAISPGEKREVTLRLSESFTAAAVDVPVVVVRGVVSDGPSLCLVGGVHGDELNGIEIVRRAVDHLVPHGLRGTVIGIPIANVFGFANQTRYLPDRRDLNRHFPGNARGSTAARIAERLFTDVIRHCTHLVDFHTGSLQRTNLPQVRGDLRNPDVLNLARAFGVPAIVHSPGSKGTLRRTAVQAGIAAVLYEAGETMRFQQPEIRRGLEGVRSILSLLGMKDGPTLVDDETEVFARTSWLRADRGGLLELTVKPGDLVRVGDVVGTVSDPLRREKGWIRAVKEGRVLGAAVAPLVLPGMAVLNVGIPAELPEPVTTSEAGETAADPSGEASGDDEGGGD